MKQIQNAISAKLSIPETMTVEGLHSSPETSDPFSTTHSSWYLPCLIADYCILNIIFALTCRVTKTRAIEKQEAFSDVFFQRALQLLQLDMIDAGSSTLLQALLLLGQYLQSSEWPHRCWAVVGLAIRVAQGLGMHILGTSRRFKNHRDRELARRLWHSCVFMDRSASLCTKKTFGQMTKGYLIG